MKVLPLLPSFGLYVNEGADAWVQSSYNRLSSKVAFYDE